MYEFIMCLISLSRCDNTFQGRDSVMAQNKKNELDSSRVILSPEQRDADFFRRLNEQFSRGKGKYKLSDLKAEFQKVDRNKSGKLKKTDVSANADC